MSDDPFSDPPTILEPPARGRTKTRPNNQAKMDQEIQEIRIVEPGRKPSRSVAGTGAAPPPVPPKKQRSLSQDGVLQAAAAMTKGSRSGNGAKAGKKAGLHVDVIDRLDYSGVGPATFHHDGPFDACAPSRNRHRNKAPMFAWAPGQEGKKEDPGVFTDGGVTFSAARDSPYAAALPPKITKQNKRTSQDPYEYPRRPASPKRRDTLADAWGKGEPEPFEEFFAPSINPAAVGHGENGTASAASSIYNNREGHGSNSKKRTNNGVRKPTNRPPLPPPQPIFPESVPMTDESALYAPEVSAGGGPQRSKSIMQRIKKMRDAPNVPVDYDDNANEISGSSSENHAARPTHRTQNSMVGRLGSRSPTSPGFGGDTTGEKGLPSLPGGSPPDESGRGGYFDKGLGRKTSIMQRVRGAVVGKTK